MTKLRHSLYLTILIYSVLTMQIVYGSDTEGEKNQTESNTEATNSPSPSPSNSTPSSNSPSNSTPSSTSTLNSTSSSSSSLSPPQTQERNELRFSNPGDGALFNPRNNLAPPPFPVMDSNGHVSVTPSYYSSIESQPTQPDSNYYISSGNTVQFPSMLGSRMRGLPTHLDYVDLNRSLADPSRNTPEYKRAERQSFPYFSSSPADHYSNAVRTEDIDQGPLAPAPKSLMEQAGWWEYLAILFGDAGDPTALRLILHRLTKLAQLQLQGSESRRVQAATAFLASHFNPLLMDSFRDFSTDPNYTRNSAMWSSDPGFSSIIRRLVDRMDYFGAQDELDRIFGPNTHVAVSFGMRQPEWLRLKLIMEQVAWDLRHPGDLIGLWSSTWKLSVPQKLSILAYAANPRVSAPLDLNLPHRELVMARINLITNGEAPKDSSLIKEESPLNQAHYHYALLQATGNLCSASPGSGNKTNTPSQSQTQEPTSTEATGLKRRVGDYCELVNLTPNFAQFCQSGPLHSTPLSSLLSAAGPKLFDKKVITYVNHLERLYWAFTWVGSCQDAREILVTLTEQVKNLGPREEAEKHGKRVPSGVSESIHIRLEYMQAVQQTCQNNMQLTGSADVAHIFSLLNYAHLNEALKEWERRFSSVAARLQGYPSGSIMIDGEGQLLYQQARDVRIALLIYKYPRSIYVPCLSQGLLTRDPSTDLTLLNLAQSLDTRRGPDTRIDPLIPEISARSLYMRALYLAGRNVEAAREAREIDALSPSELVKEFLACMELCGSATRNPCEAEKTYVKLLGPVNKTTTSGTSSTNQKQKEKAPSTANTVYTVGKELSQRLCRLSQNTAADALSLRYGKVLTTQATFSAFKRFADLSSDRGFSASIIHSKLKPGEAESILPWFGSLPPAPVEEILSFVPTHKLDFVSQVSVKGYPLIQPGKSTTTTATGNQSANDKIMILGQQYNADILTTSETGGPQKGNTEQPKIEVKDGYFQLATKDKKGNGEEGSNSSNSANGSETNTTESSEQNEES